jgi:hypothetical protein
MAISRNLKIGMIAGGVLVAIVGTYLVYKLIRKKRTMIVEGTFKGGNCDELHAFQNTGGKVVGGMNDKVKAKLEELYAKGINPEVKEVWVEMDAKKMEVKWKVEIAPSKDGKAWVGFTSRGSAGATAYDRAVGKNVWQDFDSVLKKVRESTKEPNAEMELVLDYLYNLNRKKETLGKCPTRQLFYKYTKPNKFPNH